MFCKICVLKKFTVFTGKRVCWSNKVAGLHACNFIKKKLNIRAFQLLRTNYLSVFDHFVELALKGLTELESENINEIGD